MVARNFLGSKSSFFRESAVAATMVLLKRRAIFSKNYARKGCLKTVQFCSHQGLWPEPTTGYLELFRFLGLRLKIGGPAGFPSPRARLNLLEPWLCESHTTVSIPLHHR